MVTVAAGHGDCLEGTVTRDGAEVDSRGLLRWEPIITGQANLLQTDDADMVITNSSKRTWLWTTAVLLVTQAAMASPIQARQQGQVPDPAPGTLTGRIIDSQSLQPLASVQVYIPELSIGSLSRADGSFELGGVPSGTHRVRVQQIGFRVATQEVTLAGGRPLVVNFELSREALALDEIVVTGTAGGTRARAIGNVVERLNLSEMMESRPIVSVEQALQSRTPGVSVFSGAGIAGADGGPIRIRGSSSIGLSNDPLIYIDGVRMNSDRTQVGGRAGTYSRLNDINPEDIESIEIIKGPAASTLYGTEASNGVIQIITKRGNAGAPVFDASVELGVNWIPDPGGEFPVHWGVNRAGDLITFGTSLYNVETERRGEPWFQYGPIQKYGLSVRGGTDLYRYFASFNHSDTEGFVDWNWDRRSSGRINLTSNFTEKLSADLSASYLLGSTRHPGPIWAEFIRGTVLTAADFGGRQDLRRGFGNRALEYHRDGAEDLNDVERSNWSLQLSYQPLTWLQTRSVFGHESTQETRSVTIFREENAPAGAWGAQGTGRKSVNILSGINRSLDLAATASFPLTRALSSAVSTGLQFNTKTRRSIGASGQDFVDRALTTVSAAGTPSASESFIENSTVGVYVQNELNWNQRVFLTGAVRADDNSAFGEEFSAAIYPKLSATWVVHEEPFWRWDFVEQLRLRGAWGAAGQQPDVFAATRLYRSFAGTGNVPVISPSQIGNPDLGPERGIEFEGGLDASFLDDRVQLGFTKWTKTTKDAILVAPAAPSSGFPGSQFVNAGQISNWGTELSLDTRWLSGDRLGFDLAVAFATLGSRIDDMGGLGEIAERRTRWHIEGYPIASPHALKVVSAEFVSGNRGPVTNIMCDGGTGPDGRRMGGAPVPCEEAPKVYFGRQAEPTWTVSVNPTLTVFGDLRIMATVYAEGGNMIGSDVLPSRHVSWNNERITWTLDDPIYVGQRTVDTYAMGLYKGGFATLREISASYTLPAGMTRMAGASRASLTLAARNLGILWQEQKYGEIDGQWLGHPEKSAFSEETFGVGELSNGSMPPASLFTASMRVTF